MKCVVAGYGSRGHVEPCIATARELARRGHDVRMAVTVPPDMVAAVESAGLTALPYGRDWEAPLGDEEFVRMMQDPMKALSQAVEYIAQLHEDKSTILMSVADGADLLVAGISEQGLAANVAEYYGIPLAALHFFSGGDFGVQRAAWARDEGARACPTPGARPTGSRRTVAAAGDPGLRRALRSRARGPMGGSSRPTTLRRGADARVAD